MQQGSPTTCSALACPVRGPAAGHQHGLHTYPAANRGALSHTLLNVSVSCWPVSVQGYPSTNATSFLMLGLPEEVMAGVQPQWTPLLAGASQHEWRVGLEAIEVEGPGGGLVTADLFQPSLPSQGSGGTGSESDSSSSSGSGSNSGSSGSAGQQYAPAVVDSGTTFVRLPRAAWKQFQQLIINATQVRVGVRHFNFGWK